MFFVDFCYLIGFALRNELPFGKIDDNLVGFLMVICCVWCGLVVADLNGT